MQPWEFAGYRAVRAFHSWHTQGEYTGMLRAYGGLTLSTITLEVLANSLRTLTGEKNRSYYMASSNYVYIEIIERFQ